MARRILPVVLRRFGLLRKLNRYRNTNSPVSSRIIPVNVVTTNPRIASVGLAIAFSACTVTNAPRTSIDSAGLATLATKQDVLEEYVTFRRSYIALDFRLFAAVNTGLSPGPSDYDYLIVAVVPTAEIERWTVGMKSMTSPPAPLPELRTNIDYSGVDEWFSELNKVVGVDRASGTVVYHYNAR